MEDALDEIARGEAERVPWLRRFYFGTAGAEAGPGLKALVSDIGDIDARDVSSFPLAGTDIVIRVGRYGPYLERDDQRVNVPEGTAPDELTPEFASELFSRPSGDKILGSDPGTGLTIVARAGRFGPYVTDGETNASLRRGDEPGSVTLERAIELLAARRAKGPAKTPARRRRGA